MFVSWQQLPTLMSVVFDRLDGGWDAIFQATEVDDPVTGFVTTADVTAGNHSLIVTATGFFLGDQQRFFRSGFGDVLEGRVAH